MIVNFDFKLKQSKNWTLLEINLHNSTYLYSYTFSFVAIKLCVPSDCCDEVKIMHVIYREIIENFNMD